MTLMPLEEMKGESSKHWGLHSRPSVQFEQTAVTLTPLSLSSTEVPEQQQPNSTESSPVLA